MEESEYMNICVFLQSDQNKRVWPADLLNKNKRNYRQKCAKYELLNGTLHYNHPKHGKVRVIKASEKNTILFACHKAPTSGHFGVNKTTWCQ